MLSQYESMQSSMQEDFPATTGPFTCSESYVVTAYKTRSESGSRQVALLRAWSFLHRFGVLKFECDILLGCAA